MTDQVTDERIATAPDDGMERHLAQELLQRYQQGRLSRRDALARIAAVVGSLLVAENLLAACAPQATPTPQATAAPAGVAAAQPGSSPDAAIDAGPTEYAGQGATILAYLARPQGDGPYPGVLVCHENRGLTEHIKDVARRLAGAGYVALAVDLLAREGGMDKIADASQIPSLLSNVPPEQLVQDFRDGLRHLQAQPNVRKDRIGMTGFCFGGGATWRCATQIPELRAAVPFYGSNPPLEDVPKIEAAVLAIYGEADTRIMGGVPAIEEAMTTHRKTFEKIVYPGAQHAFFNDTSARYHPEAAADAWRKMLAWFGKYLQ